MRRTRKLPKAGCRLSPPGCGRPCDHASDSVHPQTLGIPVAAQREVPTAHAFQLQVQFLGPLWCYGRCLVRWCRQLGLFRSCISSTVVDILFVPQRQIPTVPPFPKTIENSPVAVCFQVVDAPVVQVVLAMPVVVTTGAQGPDSAENCGSAAVAVPAWLWTSLWHAATSSRQSGRSLRLVHRRDVQVLRRVISPHCAAFFGLRPHGRECPFSALDDEEFFVVVEGSGWRRRRESDSQVFCHLSSMHVLAFHG